MLHASFHFVLQTVTLFLYIDYSSELMEVTIMFILNKMARKQKSDVKEERYMEQEVD